MISIMKRFLTIFCFLIAISTGVANSRISNYETTESAQDGIACTPASVSASVRYDNNMNPMVTGSVSNGTGCFWEGRVNGVDKIVYRGGGRNITAVEVNMSYSGGWNISKVAQVSISPNSKGTFSVSFPKTANGGTAYLYQVSAV